MNKMILGIFDDPKKKYEKPYVSLVETEDEGGMGAVFSKETYLREDWS